MAAKLPLQFAVYKGLGRNRQYGAAQFRLSPPRRQEGSDQDWREGCIFLEAASLKGAEGKDYDWSKKVVIALGLPDLGKLLYFLRMGVTPKGENSLSIVHDRFAQTEKSGQVFKYLNVSSPKGLATGCILSIAEKSGEEERKHIVPLSGEEVSILGTLVQAAIPAVLGWSLLPYE